MDEGQGSYRIGDCSRDHARAGAVFVSVCLEVMTSGAQASETERERERESVTVRERGRNGPWAAFGRGLDSVPEALLLFSYFLSLFFSVFF
jgi:hypothetical protein